MSPRATARTGSTASRHLSVALFFLVLLSVGLSIYRAYGLSWDEFFQRHYWRIVYLYVFQGDTTLPLYRDRFYGPVIELFLFVITERLLGLVDPQTIYFTRHFLNFFLFCVGVWFFFRLGESHFRSWRMGLVGSLLLVLSPRLFADAFYNSKDIPFLSLFILSICTLRLYLRRRSSTAALLHESYSIKVDGVTILSVFRM